MAKRVVVGVVALTVGVAVGYAAAAVAPRHRRS